MILTVVMAYPSERNGYSNAFVHTRIKAYLREGIEAKAFVLNKKVKKLETIQFEGVEVLYGDIACLSNYVNGNADVDCVCFHFLSISMLKAMSQFRTDVKALIFVHGHEALWWHQRIFPDSFANFIRVLKFCKYILVNTHSMLYIRSKINSLKIQADIVCVSDWMRRIAVDNWGLNEEKIKSHIIPNIVDETIFPYKPKTAEKRYKLLTVRNFSSGKYAPDVAMDTIIALQKYPEADRIEVAIYGDGWLFEKYTSRVRNYSNVKISRGMLTHSEIAKVHEENGFFICPTRQDAQGVSMCEAMSSGLVPISSPNTAIPEYLPQEYNLAPATAQEAAARIIELIRDEKQFLELSEKVSAFIREKCSTKQTTEKEIELMKQMAKK